MSLDGNGDYVTIATSSSLQGTNITVMAWINGTTLAGDERAIVTYLQSNGMGNGVSYELQTNASGTYPQFRIYSGGDWHQVVSPEAISTNTWYHLAGQYNGTHLSIWVNGILKNTLDYSSGLDYTDPTALYIGCYAFHSDLFNGTIDEVQIHTRALSEQEINASYNASAYRLENNLTSLSDGQYAYYGFAVDATGNQNKTETRTLTVDQTAPSNVVYVSPTPANNSNQPETYSYINVTFTETYPDTCLLAYVYGNSTESNLTMTRSGNVCSLNVTPQTINGETNFTVYVNDTAGNWGSNLTYYYFIISQYTNPFAGSGGYVPTPTPASTPTATPTATLVPSPAPSASAEPIASPTPEPSLQPTATAVVEKEGYAVLPANLPFSVSSGQIVSAKIVEFGFMSNSERVPSSETEAKSKTCNGGATIKILVKRVTRVIETSAGIRTQIDLVVSNVGSSTAFGISVDEQISRVAGFNEVNFNVQPSYTKGTVSWFIDELAPGESRTFSYSVAKRLSVDEVGKLGNPVVKVKSVAAASTDFSLFYAAVALVAISLLTVAFNRFKTEKT